MQALAVVVAWIVVGAVGVSTATATGAHGLGVAHPPSPIEALAPGPLEWVLTGGLGPTQVTITARTVTPASEVQVLVARSSDMRSARTVEASTTDPSDPALVRAHVDDLLPDTTYHLRVVVDGDPDPARQMRVRTPPRGAASFTVAFGACAETGSSGSVFDTIAAHDPLLYLITGDLHYGDVDTDDAPLLRSILDRTLSAPAQQALYLRTPIAYTWDDHDFGGNDSGADSPAREMAQQTYRAVFPHAPLIDDESIEHAFTIGRVRFVLTDNRSHRVPNPDGSGTVLGEDQLAWFEDELVTARRRGQAVVWVNSIPWIGAADPTSDTWSGFPDERRLVADMIERSGVEVLMLGGDAHMVAIDDGTNSGYASSGAPGFPVAHAGALDRPGSIKGGPYSHGAFPGSGQFGLLEIDDDGRNEIRIRVTGQSWEDAVLVGLDVVLAVQAPTRRTLAGWTMTSLATQSREWYEPTHSSLLVVRATARTAGADERGA